MSCVTHNPLLQTSCDHRSITFERVYGLNYVNDRVSIASDRTNTQRTKTILFHVTKHLQNKSLFLTHSPVFL